MTLIGMLHYRKSPVQVKKAYACAAVAKMEGVEFVYFSYSAVDFTGNSILGWQFLEGKWSEKTVSFPDVILNISGPRTDVQKEIWRKLKRNIPFTSFPVGNKMRVYKKVKKGQEFAGYLIPSVKLKSEEVVLSLVNQYTKIVIKPYSGNHGKKVIFIEKMTDGHFMIIEGEKQQSYSEKDVRTHTMKLKKEQSYLVQPFIKCKTKAGFSYDFRLHVQKNGIGEWEITLIYPRISGNKKLISNISGGGYRGELDSFLKEEFGYEHFNMRRTLEHFAIAFSKHLDELYERSFDELGIDVGVDEQQNLWIFEVNWRPGSKHREFEVAKRLVPYAIYLANR